MQLEAMINFAKGLDLPRNLIKFSSLLFMLRVNSYKACCRYNTVYVLVITLQTNSNIKTTATRPVADTTQCTYW
jgi:hypothetical protein